MYKNIYNLKQVCKSFAANIKEQKDKSKQLFNEGKTHEGQRQHNAIDGMRRNYRHYHIAHCLLRGKTYNEVEQPKEEQKKLTEYDWKVIEQIRSNYAIEETLHISA